MSALPGQTRPLREVAFCACCAHEKNAQIPAVTELCTEADSMGAEWTPVCEQCLAMSRTAAEQARYELGDCEIGNHRSLDVRPWRDPEEGHNGPVYMACAECRAQAAREFEAGMEDWRDDDELDADVDNPHDKYPTDPDIDFDQDLTLIENNNARDD